MIVLPWFVRFGLDCTIAITPLVYFAFHPTTHLFEYFQNRRRIVRRKNIDSFARVDHESGPSFEETKNLYKQLGIEM